MRNHHLPPVVFLQGIDGSGKSTTAQHAAQMVSRHNPGQTISVVDSTGLFSYHGGELTNHSYAGIESMEPQSHHGRFNTVAHLGAFSVGRRYAHHKAIHNSDLVLSVRDPHRIDPAVYSAAYSDRFRNMTPEARLAFFDHTARSPYASAIVQLNVPTDAATRNIDARGGERDAHESDDTMAMLAADLPQVIHAYRQRYGTEVVEVNGLQPYTVEDVAQAIEPLAYHQHLTAV